LVASLFCDEGLGSDGLAVCSSPADCCASETEVMLSMIFSGAFSRFLTCGLGETVFSVSTVFSFLSISDFGCGDVFERLVSFVPEGREGD